MSSSRQSQKAVQYVRALDDERCDGNWSVIPELVRKVRKHAPDRKCLALVAETECLISQTTLTHASQNRPMTALTTKDLGVADHLPKLLSCIEQGDAYPEDKFQAQVCVGWLHWVVGEYNLAALRLPANLEEDYAALNATGKLSEWTNVCALKAAYLKANCFARNNERGEALAVFESGLQAVRSVWAGGAPRKQLRYWAELFLTEYCMLSSQALNRHEKSLEETNSLACFRSWARYWETQSGSLAGGHGFRGSVPRRRIWNEYYIALSRIVETDLPFPTGYLGKIPTDHSARSQLRMELKRIETAYESLLLRETEFPRADEEREEVEDFIKLVLKNWVVMCGRGWREHDLGPGGRESMGRGVLELLYRASTKTYHSTQILRGLFQLHLAVADFDLAFKAFDSYMELIKKGKARVGKTGSPEPSLDNDGIVLQTMAQCLLARCRYGDRAATEKAWELAGELEDWLARLPQLQSSTSEAGSTQSPVATLTEILEESPLHPKVRPNILGLVWQAIGLAHASWSRLMYDAALRSEIQTKAVRCLRKSLSAEFGRSRDIRGIFALGLLLAERRELTPAIEMVKMALMSGRSKDAESELQHGPYWQERALIPLWHLLALLLSARQEFFLAARACEGAFEQFKDPAVLFGHEDPSYRSDHLNEAEKRDGPRYSQGVVDEMDDLEKETILEVKMTQLALIELNEGPDVAVNASYELLTLFSRLFGSVQAKPAFSPAPPATSKPPKSSAATLRSIKGSIFGRRSSRSVGPASREVSNVSEMTAGTTQSRPHTTQTTASTAPAIQITQENGHTLDKRSSRKMSSEMRRRSESGRRHSLRKRDSSSGSRKRATSSGPTSHKPTIVDGESFFTPEGEGTTDPFTFASKRQPSIASSFSRGRSLPHLDSYLSTKTRASEYSDVSTDATYTIASCLPIVQFSKEDERRQRSVILVRVWLMIAGFYRRAEMFDDCKGAIAEAQKIVGQLESDDARDSGSLVERSDVWGVKRSVEDLMGDVWTELGCLALGRDQPYAARDDFEAALVRSPNHPFAIVGLSHILLDIYTEKLLPPPSIPALGQPDTSTDPTLHPSDPTPKQKPHPNSSQSISERTPHLPSAPLGLSKSPSASLRYGQSSRRRTLLAADSDVKDEDDEKEDENTLPPPHRLTSLPLLDRIAARDRAYGLLSGLTKLGSGWNLSEAWFALARACEESGQSDRAKEVLWWCVELEEGRGVREWSSLGSGGYVL